MTKISGSILLAASLLAASAAGATGPGGPLSLALVAHATSIATSHEL